MLLAYVDESYTDNWFTMAALLVDGPAAAALTFHAKGERKNVPPRARIGVFDDVIEAVAGQDVRVIARAMDVIGKRARYNRPDPAHKLVLQHLLERVDEYVTSIGEY